MTWEFSTEPEFQSQLDWMKDFVEEECEPLDLLWYDLAYAPHPPWLRAAIQPLKEQVKQRGLWACHLGPDLGGPGYGQVKLALMTEIMGRTRWGPVIFGCQGPDSGNAEILAHYGTEEQKAKYLQPLLDGEIKSCFSMSEPHGGSDPTRLRTRAERDGDEWVITGEKWFSSMARAASFLVTLAVTNPDVHPYRGMSMFLIPGDAPGLEIIRDVGTAGEPFGTGAHAYLRYDGVRVPADNLLGPEGEGFVVAQTRLGGGRVHHAMRAVGTCNKAMEMMCERALSRETANGVLADKQLIQQYVAESFAQIQQFRLFVLYTAWLIDQHGSAAARKEIAASKNLAAKVVHDVVARAVQVHGALGMSNETPLAQMWIEVPWMGVMDGPTEVHAGTIARQVLKEHRAAPGQWPTRWIPARLEAARVKHAVALATRAEHERPA